jgi:alcohol dehydrogenase
LWNKNITITTGLVDTSSTPMLLKAVASEKIQAKKLVTHHFAFEHILDAYDTFRDAAKTHALKIVISMQAPH